MPIYWQNSLSGLYQVVHLITIVLRSFSDLAQFMGAQRKGAQGRDAQRMELGDVGDLDHLKASSFNAYSITGLYFALHCWSVKGWASELFFLRQKGKSGV